ncbi:LacI family DNA-binding transcriptional regulator [Frigoribacterium faeni]|uniref:LacI family DNA-binding transcriptional regulator n=1 Tax=Frigoribacterium faeni TaxID=145483 RepID=UPI002412EAA3|nr:LacI family DNA-binding transcriptional regulator [Frigoribacterium faeni]
MTRTASASVTIVEVARQAGVAISTASTALNNRAGVSEQTRERVQGVAQSLGYVPSIRGRSLSSKRAFAIGLIVQRDPDVLESDPFFGAFIGGVEEVLAPRGYALALQIAKDEASSLARHIELAESGRVDGLLLNELHIDDERWRALKSRGVPAVAVNPGTFDSALPSVVQDGEQAIDDLIGHLVERGHERIAHVAGPPAFVHARNRSMAWRTAIRARGLEASVEVCGDFTYEGGQRAADLILNLEERPSAVFCANDLSAIGFLNRALELGLEVPDDLAIAGFDGILPGQWVRPALTTIKTSPRSLGREAAQLLLLSIDGEQPHDITIPPAEFHARESTSS